MNKDDTVYLLNGKEVYFFKKIEEGVLVTDVLRYENDGLYAYSSGSVAYLVPEVFEFPPITIYSDEIRTLKQEVEDIRIQKNKVLGELNFVQNKMEQLKKKIGEIDGI